MRSNNVGGDDDYDDDGMLSPSPSPRTTSTSQSHHHHPRTDYKSTNLPLALVVIMFIAGSSLMIFNNVSCGLRSGYYEGGMYYAYNGDYYSWEGEGCWTYYYIGLLLLVLSLVGLYFVEKKKFREFENRNDGGDGGRKKQQRWCVLLLLVVVWIFVFVPLILIPSKGPRVLISWVWAVIIFFAVSLFIFLIRLCMTGNDSSIMNVNASEYFSNTKKNILDLPKRCMLLPYSLRNELKEIWDVSPTHFNVDEILFPILICVGGNILLAMSAKGVFTDIWPPDDALDDHQARLITMSLKLISAFTIIVGYIALFMALRRYYNLWKAIKSVSRRSGNFINDDEMNRRRRLHLCQTLDNLARRLACVILIPVIAFIMPVCVLKITSRINFTGVDIEPKDAIVAFLIYLGFFIGIIIVLKFLVWLNGKIGCYTPPPSDDGEDTSGNEHGDSGNDSSSSSSDEESGLGRRHGNDPPKPTTGIGGNVDTTTATGNILSNISGFAIIVAGTFSILSIFCWLVYCVWRWSQKNL